MHGDINRPVTKPARISPMNQSIGEQENQNNLNQPSKNRSRRITQRWLLLLGILALTVGAISAYYYFKNNKVNQTLPYPISAQTAGLLGFDIYYPNQNRLPKGYTLNRNSFSVSNQTVIYSVSYGNNQKIVFSDQAKPSAAQIQEFYAKNLPLNSTLPTNIGSATIGAINAQTVVSLPTNTNAWIIITASGNINQQQLDSVIKSLRLSK